MEKIIHSNAPLSEEDKKLIEDYSALGDYLQEFRKNHPGVIVFAVYGHVGQEKGKKDQLGSFMHGSNLELCYAVCRMAKKAGIIDELASSVAWNLTR